MSLSLKVHFRIDASKSLQEVWTVDDPEKVTIGRSPKSTIWILDANADFEQLVIERRGTKLYLLTSKLMGALKIGERRIDIEDLRDVGLAHDSIQLTEKSQGMLQIGQTQIEFWVRPYASKTEIPFRKLVQRLREGIPLSILVAIVFSSLLQYGLYKFVNALPPTKPPTVRQIQQYVTRIEVPSKEYIESKLWTETPVRSKTKMKSRPRPLNRQAKGFLSAISGKKGDRSPFEGLFSTNALSDKLPTSITDRSFDKAIRSAARSKRGSGSGSPTKFELGSLRQKGLHEASLQKSQSRPVVSKLSVEVDQSGGNIDRGALERLITSRSGELRDCYEVALARKPGIAGKVVISLSILKTGRASNVAVDDSSINDSGFRRCLIRKVNAWSYPQPSKKTGMILLPFVFSPASRG